MNTKTNNYTEEEIKNIENTIIIMKEYSRQKFDYLVDKANDEYADKIMAVLGMENDGVNNSHFDSIDEFISDSEAAGCRNTGRIEETDDSDTAISNLIVEYIDHCLELIKTKYPSGDMYYIILNCEFGVSQKQTPNKTFCEVVQDELESAGLTSPKKTTIFKLRKEGLYILSRMFFNKKDSVFKIIFKNYYKNLKN